MKQRCTNPNSNNYHNYGGRGIRVCDRWRNSFETFLEDLGERTEGTTLNRIDPNGNYEKFHSATGELQCHWGTPDDQDRCRRRPRIKQANKKHKSPRKRANSTGFKGISRSGYRYQARISINGKQKHLGYRATPEAAYHELWVPAAQDQLITCDV